MSENPSIERQSPVIEGLADIMDQVSILEAILADFLSPVTPPTPTEKEPEKAMVLKQIDAIRRRLKDIHNRLAV